MKQLAKRASVAPSPTHAVSTLVKKLSAEGKPVFDFSTGELPFELPKHVRKAIAKSLKAGNTRYTPVVGEMGTRKAICGYFSSTLGLDYNPSQIVITAGAKQGLYNLFQALVEHGDEVIIPAPYWVSYPGMVELAGAKPVIVDCNASGGYLTPKALYSAITANTRAVILNSPGNPNGIVYTRAELEELAAVLGQFPDIVVVSDEIYRHIRYEKTEVLSILQAAPQLTDRTVVIDGWSKFCAATGLRLGWAAGPEYIIAAMAMIQGQSTSNAVSILQAGLKVALENPLTFLPEWLDILTTRRNTAVTKLNAMSWITCDVPQGAFYVFPNISAVLFKKTADDVSIDTDFLLCQYLLETAGVACVPGSAFGSPNNIRLSFAVDGKTLDDGLEAMAASLALLK